MTIKNRFPGQTCLFCSNPSVGVGEHVWPTWFIKEFSEQGLFTASHGDAVYMTRAGVPQTSTALPSVHVPACETCNTALNKYLEESAKPVVRALLEHADSGEDLILSQSDAAALARWLLKVGLLSAHPARSYDHVGMDRDADIPQLDTVRPEWLAWMPTGDDPPEGFSVFLSRRDLSGNDPVPEIKQTVVVPHVVVDGDDLNYMVRAFGLTGMTATIVWHPGWPISHPQVANGRAVQIWPQPHEFNFGSLPTVHPKELVLWAGPRALSSMSAASFAKSAQVPLAPGVQNFLSGFFGDDDGADSAVK